MINISQLEGARKLKGLSRGEMARRLKLPHQNNYHNWVYRNSIPKEYLVAAQDIYNELTGGITAKDGEVIAKIKSEITELSYDELAKVLDMVHLVKAARPSSEG